jgi:hypothetical protein
MPLELVVTWRHEIFLKPDTCIFVLASLLR